MARTIFLFINIAWKITRRRIPYHFVVVENLLQKISKNLLQKISKSWYSKKTRKYDWANKATKHRPKTNNKKICQF